MCAYSGIHLLIVATDRPFLLANLGRFKFVVFG